VGERVPADAADEREIMSVDIDATDLDATDLDATDLDATERPEDTGGDRVLGDNPSGGANVVDVLFLLPADVDAERAELCADFTDWQPLAMTRSDAGFQVTVPLPVGSTHEYRYLLDGHRWEDAWDAEEYVDNAFGTRNSVVHVAAQMG
jgi:1,4-alpha-glucan branching enzyme